MATRSRRASERGILHGLSLVAITVALFGLLAFFALKEVPQGCRCADGTSVESVRGLLEAAKNHCAERCRTHGGGGPAVKEPPKPKQGPPRPP